MGQADPLPEHCSVKGCRKQHIFIWLARCGMKLGVPEKNDFDKSKHGVLVWWGNLWLESAISAEASGRT
jgi:hypothetical protein